jgi:N-acetylglucosamine malate deacetylase 2
MTGKQAAAIIGALAERSTVSARAMIVVAHPDDETIGMGAQLSRFADALLVQVTDGAPRDGRDAAAHGFATVAEYAAARRHELAAALRAGEARGIRTDIIGIPDRETHLNLSALIIELFARLQSECPEVVFVQPYEGGHPDHDAASFAVNVACRLSKAQGRPLPAIIEMTAYHAQGDWLETGNFLTAPRPLSTLTLDAPERLRKRRMLDCFVSQRKLLAAFGTGIERFREAPDYDFTQPPYQGELHYERLGWNITGALWRRHARAALGSLGLDSGSGWD